MLKKFENPINVVPLHDCVPLVVVAKGCKVQGGRILSQGTVDTFVHVSSSIFTRSFAVVLGLICTFRTKVLSSLGDRTRLLPEWYDGSVVPWCLYLHTIVCTDERGTFRCLEIAPKEDQTCGGV